MVEFGKWTLLFVAVALVLAGCRGASGVRVDPGEAAGDPAAGPPEQSPPESEPGSGAPERTCSDGEVPEVRAVSVAFVEDYDVSGDAITIGLSASCVAAEVVHGSLEVADPQGTVQVPFAFDMEASVAAVYPAPKLDTERTVSIRVLPSDGRYTASGDPLEFVVPARPATATPTGGGGSVPSPPVELPEVEISAPPSVTEGSPITFTLTLSFAPASPLSIEIAHGETNGNRVSASSPTTVTGITSTTSVATLPTRGDEDDEPDSFVTLTVRGPSESAYTVGTKRSATVALRDVEPPPPPPNKASCFEPVYTNGELTGLEFPTPDCLATRLGFSRDWPYLTAASGLQPPTFTRDGALGTAASVCGHDGRTDSSGRYCSVDSVEDSFEYLQIHSTEVFAYYDADAARREEIAAAWDRIANAPCAGGVRLHSDRDRPALHFFYDGHFVAGPPVAGSGSERSTDGPPLQQVTYRPKFPNTCFDTMSLDATTTTAGISVAFTAQPNGSIVGTVDCQSFTGATTTVQAVIDNLYLVVWNDGIGDLGSVPSLPASKVHVAWCS